MKISGLVVEHFKQESEVSRVSCVDKKVIPRSPFVMTLEKERYMRTESFKRQEAVSNN